MRSWYPPYARLFLFIKVLLNGRMRLNLSMAHFKFLSMLENMKKRLALCVSLQDLKNEASFAIMFLLDYELLSYALLYQAQYDTLFELTKFND